MIGPLVIAAIVLVLLMWVLASRAAQSSRRTTLRAMVSRDRAQFGIRDNRTGIVEIKSTQASSLNDPRWMNGPFSTVMRMVDQHGQPLPDERGQWIIDFVPDP